nr:hypothetical protein [Tanacetum cinerariifolium]
MLGPKTYEELSKMEKLHNTCDLKAANIVLLGLPPDVFALFNHHKVSKEIWDRVKLLMQGTSLTKQERECKLYDEFDKLTHVKGETLYTYYLRFAQLINEMNTINMTMKTVQVNTKFLNSLPYECGKFVTNVKLARDLHTSSFDQLYGYLEQHEIHANETRIIHERYPHPLALVANYHQPPSQSNNYQTQYNPPQYQHHFSPPTHQVYSPPPQSTPYELPLHQQHYQPQSQSTFNHSQPSITQSEYLQMIMPQQPQQSRVELPQVES